MLAQIERESVKAFLAQDMLDLRRASVIPRTPKHSASERKAGSSSGFASSAQAEAVRRTGPGQAGRRVPCIAGARRRTREVGDRFPVNEAELAPPWGRINACPRDDRPG